MWDDLDMGCTHLDTQITPDTHRTKRNRVIDSQQHPSNFGNRGLDLKEESQWRHDLEFGSCDEQLIA